jgi:hypothetical protein
MIVSWGSQKRVFVASSDTASHAESVVGSCIHLNLPAHILQSVTQLIAYHISSSKLSLYVYSGCSSLTYFVYVPLKLGILAKSQAEYIDRVKALMHNI